MNGERIRVGRVSRTKKCLVVSVRDDTQDVVDGVRGGRRLPRIRHGRPIELVELTITRTVACSSKPSNIERSISLRCELTGMELIVLAIRILTG